MSFAGSHKWTPSGISELNFITIFINEMVHLVENIIKEERRDYLEVIQPALASFFSSSFELVIKLIKIRPKLTKKCPPSAHQRDQELHKSKTSISLRLVKSCKVFMQIQKECSEKFKITPFRSTFFVSYIKMLAECISHSP